MLSIFPAIFWGFSFSWFIMHVKYHINNCLTFIDSHFDTEFSETNIVFSSCASFISHSSSSIVRLGLLPMIDYWNLWINFMLVLGLGVKVFLGLCSIFANVPPDEFEFVALFGWLSHRDLFQCRYSIHLQFLVGW